MSESNKCERCYGSIAEKKVTMDDHVYHYICFFNLFTCPHCNDFIIKKGEKYIQYDIHYYHLTCFLERRWDEVHKL